MAYKFGERSEKRLLGVHPDLILVMRRALEKGSVVAFPSILEHRVTPVTRGVRYSATMWFHGPRFR